jgi:ubiquinone/menaquinone biosynthesis C-methylase UbiE
LRLAALEKREWADAGVAQSYARVFAKAADMVVPHLVHAVQARPGIEALDLCCGHGNVTSGLVLAGAQTTGLDFSLAMLGMARAAAPEAQFVEGDAMALVFDDASFDAVTIGFGMPHVPDPPKGQRGRGRPANAKQYIELRSMP